MKTITRCCAIMGAVLTLIFGAPQAGAGDLAQVVGADEVIAPSGEAVVIDHGHVDVGISVVDGQLKFLARDDSTAQPTWRRLEDIVFYSNDKALLPVPEDKTFSFVGASPGQPVWVLPQIELAGVPWVGWSTQAPSLVESVDRGISMEFLGHQGPGEFSLFLENGGFEAPQVLWSTSAKKSDPFWVDLNTHTHANWTFSEPGIHLIGIRVSGKRKDGTSFSADGVLRFAIGSGTDESVAQNIQWLQTATASQQKIPRWVLLLLGVGITFLLASIVAVLRSRRESRHD